MIDYITLSVINNYLRGLYVYRYLHYMDILFFSRNLIILSMKITNYYTILTIFYDECVTYICIIMQIWHSCQHIVNTINLNFLIV